MSPVIIRGAGGNVESYGGLFEGHPHEITQLHQFRFRGVLQGKFVQGFIHLKNVPVIAWRGDIHLFELNPLQFAAMAAGVFAAGLLNQDTPDGFSGSRKKMRAVGILGVFIANHAQPGFMYQRRGLQGLVGRFAGHFGSSQFSQLIINQRQEFVCRLVITIFDDFQYVRNFTQSETSIKAYRGGEEKPGDEAEAVSPVEPVEKPFLIEALPKSAT